jgi:hypothetical protein
MDTQLLLIIVASSVVFIGVIVWKLIWLYKKMAVAEQQQTDKLKD